jgi:hypothetical protein
VRTPDGRHGTLSAERVEGERHAVRYEFLIREQLSPLVRDAFPELEIHPGPVGGTVLYGPVPDDAALHGLFARFANLGISIVELRQLPD